MACVVRVHLPLKLGRHMPPSLMAKKRGRSSGQSGLYADKNVAFYVRDHDKDCILRLIEREGGTIKPYSSEIDLLIMGWPQGEEEKAVWDQASADQTAGATFELVDLRVNIHEYRDIMHKLVPTEMIIRAMQDGDADWLRPFATGYSFSGLALKSVRIGLGSDNTFTDCKFDGTEFCKGWEASFANCQFRNVRIEEASQQFIFGRPSNCTFTRCDGMLCMRDPVDIIAPSSTLGLFGTVSGARIAGSVCNFWQARVMEHCDLTKTDMGSIQSLSIRHCTLDGMTFRRRVPPKFRVGDGHTITMENCRLRSTSAVGAIFPEIIRNVVFQRCDLRRVSFRGSLLTDVTFKNCNLQQANFRDARFLDVTFSTSSLEKAAFKGAAMWSPIKGLRGKHAKGAKVESLGTISQTSFGPLQKQAEKGSFFRTTLNVRKDAQDYVLEMRNFDVSEGRRIEVNTRFNSHVPGQQGHGSQFDTIELRQAAILAEQEFHGAEIRWETLKVFVEEEEVGGIALNELIVDMWAETILHKVLDGKAKAEVVSNGARELDEEEQRLDDFLGQLFLDAKGVKAWNADMASIIALGELTDGAYEEANLKGARLLAFSATDFTRAKLRGAKLGNAAAYNYPTELPSRILGKVERIYGFHDFSASIFDEADLRDARVVNCRLSGAQFNQANLQGAYFRKCHFKNTKFIGANLRSAYFVDCIFERSDFTDAQVEKTQFSGRYNSVKWPKGFNPK